MPAFLAFERHTKDLPLDRRAKLFADEFAPKYRDFYAELGRIEGDGGPPPGAKLEKQALGLLDPAHMEALPDFPPLTQARFEVVARRTGPDFNQAQATFVRAFPDFRCPATITFGPSFLHFDGHVYRDKDGQHMLFGVDALALEHRPAEMPAVYAHELFHIYHGELLGKSFGSNDVQVWWSMWVEGLATYVSQRLNPGLSAQQALGFPADLVVRMQKPGARKRAARLMLADFDASGSEWFDSRRSVSGLPPRAGYFMDYQMAAELGRGHSLAWLAHLPVPRVKTEVHKFLEAESR